MKPEDKPRTFHLLKRTIEGQHLNYSIRSKTKIR